MKVLVTGASGFLGSHVAERLATAGHDVRVLVRRTSNRKFLETLPRARIEFAEGSVEDAARVEEAVVGVDAIVHSAGVVKALTAADFHTTNVQGTQNLLEAARKLVRAGGALRRFVQVSSLEASGPSRDGEPVSLAQEEPCTEYGRSKLAAEKACLALKDELPITILRPTAIYGPRDNELLEAFRAVKRRVLPLTGDGTTKYTFVYGPDCAEACIRALDAEVPSGSIYFVADGDVWEQRASMMKIEDALDQRALMRAGVPFGVMRAAAFFVEAYGKAAKKPVMLTREKVAMLENHFVCDAAATRAALGWEPEVRWPEGTRLTAKWYLEHGWL
ncbi:MAG: NAD(P)-dependent oxidoreductase [Myxococcales bacterium]|jgi:nucleoside-diphosphate-sugar epimerase|nr:NAD(P)-dependent oxidoreductase [Myxococcales bacterium]MBL0194963.1 NAD(P)-dependent oxidoreductase [Myxococcales bacterium]HQY61060.1 NAD(P)-dependent oxidoreductase [Polyangiaceae bacterium]